MSTDRRPRVVIVVSHPGTAQAFLLYQLELLSRAYDVSLVANAPAEELRFLPSSVRPVSVRLVRRPSPLRDLAALADLIRLFRRERFALVHSMTPKAGLLAMTAAFLARVPVRLHTFMGEVWATRRGWSRWLLRQADRATAAMATDVLAVSPTELAFLRSEGVVAPEDGRVLANGSVAGVDPERFSPDPAIRRSVRSDLRIREGDVLFLYLGRLNRDKGVISLLHAWRRVTSSTADGHLLIIGDDEEGLLELPVAREAERLTVLGHTSEPERYLRAVDVLCLPSRREGFGNVIIEAAAAGVPTIASRIYGVVDAVVDGETGLLCEPDDVTALADRMITLLVDPELRHRLGRAARDRAVSMFSEETVAAALTRTYEIALRTRATSDS
jgi:glycosyltransferase involved in cell wall biosynthesis